LAITWVRLREVTDDGAARNVLTLMLVFLGCCALGIWFLLLSGYSLRARLLGLLGCVLGIVLFFSAFRIEHVTGELVPAFRPRWQPAADELLEQAQAEPRTAGIDLSTTSPADFPQFRGADRDGWVQGVSLATDWTRSPPQRLWSQPIGAGWSGFVVVNGCAVTMEQRGEEELVTCYDAETGALIWSHAEHTRHSTVLGGVGPRSTPTIFEGKVYALGATGRLNCLAGDTGEVVWRHDLLQLFGTDEAELAGAVSWGRSNSPLMVDDLVIVPAGGPRAGPHVSLAAFDRVTGEIIWQAGDRQVSYSSPILATLLDTQQIISVNEDNVTAHDPQSGAVLWAFDGWDGSSAGNANAAQPVIVSDQQILLSKAYGKGGLLLELARESGGQFKVETPWGEKTNPSILKTKFTSAIVRDGFSYALSDGILECVELASGKQRWRPRQARYGPGQVLGVGDVILVQAESGEVAMVQVDPQRFRELGRFQALEGKTWNNLCLSGDLLLVRNAEQAACYRLPLQGNGLPFQERRGNSE